MSRLVSPSARVRVEARIAPRALPRSLMSVYYLDERQFREMAERLEKEETFSRLLERGVIERVRYRGNIPQHRYEEYKDQEMVRFFEKYAITRQPDWQLDFLGPGALARRQQLARKYRVPLGPLTGVLRYMNYLSSLQQCSPSFSVSTREEEPSFLEFRASPSTFDTGPHIERIRRFIERAGLSPEEFNELFLACKPDFEAIQRRIPGPVEEIRAILETLEKIQILNSLHFEMRDSPAPRKTDKGRACTVAEVVRGKESLDLELHFLGDNLYDVKYRLHTDIPETKLSARDRDFLEQIKAVNQRKTVLCRIVACLFRNQYRYLLTGDPLQMAPLTQAQMARELQEEEATISRLIRDKHLSSPHGDLPVKRLFRKVAEVVKDLIALREARELAAGAIASPYTDTQLQGILEAEYGLRLSRRAITYHRNRTKAGANFYSRNRLRKPAAATAS
ncbi:MAG: hypothetical protein HY303_05340 [Candidatus Wallbacteria bacterium]|nr:hypothetical protein [Candidatus Wallbacteria bacterium]